MIWRCSGNKKKKTPGIPKKWSAWLVLNIQMLETLQYFCNFQTQIR